MAKITRIKASDSPKDKKPADTISEPPITRKKVKIADKKTEKMAKKAKKQKAREAKAKENSGKKVFILFRPFVAFGRYLRNSWREIRQVRWPNRKTTWKMVLAVLVYTAIFVLIISLLDMFFTWLFSLIIK